MMKKFLLVATISAGVSIISGLLHNVLYGVFDVEEAPLFIIAVFIAPAVFLVGVIGSIVLAIKGYRRRNKTPSP